MEHILQHLPYQEPFLFIDRLEEISDDGVTGTFTFDKDLYFYKGHFRDYPVTPGVILTECMAQIGLACLGVHLLRESSLKGAGIALTSTDVSFFHPVLPGEKVRVFSEKIYFRFNKLKCRTRMENAMGKLVCKGVLSGMVSRHE